MTITVHPFFEPTSGSFSFIVANPESKCCAIIDAALGMELARHAVNTDRADQMLDWIAAHGYVVRWILETHIHADRPSASGYLKSKLLCAQTATGRGHPQIQGYDRLLQEGDILALGHASGRVIATPGHTPWSVSYQFSNAVFVGNTLLMPDSGTARCDLAGGCARELYHSIQRLLDLPGDARLFVSYDGNHSGRRPQYFATVNCQRTHNVYLASAANVESFVALRQDKDAALMPPRWQSVAVPANLRCMNLCDVQSLVLQWANASG